MDYRLLCRQIESLSGEAPDWLPVMANASALLYHAMQDVNWAGFYLVRGDHLILGPFQGKVACVRIAKGKGVCGTAWEDNAIQLVPDVHAFVGHIACDPESRSEIVLPIRREGKVVAVLDIDSPVPGRFTEEDREGLDLFVKTLEEHMDMAGL